MLKSKPQEWSEHLTGEILAFNLIGKLLYDYPQIDWYSQLFQEGVFEEVPFGESQADVQAGLAMLRSWWHKNTALQPKDWFEKLEADYTRLFIGPDKVLAPPWESVFVSEGRLVFTETTLEVRNFYRRFGLEVERLHHEPDDHIGLEMAFVAHLGSLGLQALESGQLGEFENYLAAQREFYSQHIAAWGVRFFDQLGDYARTDFFKGIARLGKGLLFDLAQGLDIPVETIEV